MKAGGKMKADTGSLMRFAIKNFTCFYHDYQALLP